MSESDNIYDFLPETSPQHAPTAREKEFQPWHKPRKMWVRLNQWTKDIENLLAAFRLDGRPLTYLSLPGKDMLDIRILHQFCRNKGIRLKYLGFCDDSPTTEEETDTNISENEISDSQVISPESIVRTDNFAALANKNSKAFGDIEKFGDFDIINLDLCHSISALSDPQYHDALVNLFNHQIKNRSKPWIFFLTSRSDFGAIKEDHLPKYWKGIVDNAERHAAFKVRIQELVGELFVEKGAELIVNNEYVKGIGVESFSKLFGIGIGKWLLALMMSEQPVWPVQLLDSCYYRVHHDCPDMISLGFHFSQVTKPKKDASGLASVKEDDVEVDEATFAVGIVTQIGNLMDLDLHLRMDPDLHEDMISKSIALLESARYPVEKYLSFVMGKQPKYPDDIDKQVWDKLESNFEVGKKYAGYVSNLAEFGAFIEIGGITGLLHVSTLQSGYTISRPADLFKIGEKVMVSVARKNKVKRRISLALVDFEHPTRKKILTQSESVGSFGAILAEALRAKA